MEYILGVDGGGTKTVVRIADLKGRTLSEVICKAGNYKSVGIENARGNITQGIITASSNIKDHKEIFFKSACFGLSGLDSEKDGAVFRKMILIKEIKPLLDLNKVIFCNDSRIGLEAGSSNKNALMIICGTGSNCFGINEFGVEAKANGWDYILGDEGSGYDTGIKALRAVMRAHDKRGAKTILEEMILKELLLKNVEELIEWTYSKKFTSDRFASLARVVCMAAEQNDRAAINILKKQTDEALISISSVVRQLGISKKSFDVVFVGSLFRCEKYFKAVLESKLMNKFDKIVFKPLKDKPVYGAIKLAIKNIQTHQTQGQGLV